MENLLVPYQAVKKIDATRVLVLAPHSDDEVFGCGGAIMRHVEQHVPVHVIIVTNGAYGISQESESDYIHQRQQESIAAATVLRYGKPEFWQYQDRELCYGEKLITEITNAILETKSDLVYAPSVYEIHPDHRALGMATIEAVRRFDRPIQLALYEVGQPIRPNLLLDISDLAARKMEAMGCFASQNAKQRYDLDIAALNRYRTYTLPAEVTAAEAYILTNTEKLTDDPLKLYQSEHTRQRKENLAIDAKDLPLVSVIIRSMDRSTLSDALDSVALQTYPNIEVILVNAKGQGHQAVDDWCGRFPLRMTENNEPLHRSKAANTGMETANGKYLIFLDDDDFFYPEHIDNLVATLKNRPTISCVYSGVRVEHYVDDVFDTISEFNEPYNPHKLLSRNYIPIHAVLFDKSLVVSGQCAFDETLNVFEDWDFWIQVSQRCEIVHIDKITAVYRNYGHSGLGHGQDNLFLRQTRSKVYEKWKDQLSGEQLEDMIQYWDDKIVDLQKLAAGLNQQNTILNQQVIDLNRQASADTNKIETLQNRIDHLEKEKHSSGLHKQSMLESISALQSANKRLTHVITDLTQSSSWKITAPLRFLSRIFRGQYSEAFASLRRRITPFLRIVYWRTPAKWRDKMLTLAYRLAGPFFSGMSHYESWRASSKYATYDFPDNTTGFLANMVDIDRISPLTSTPPGRVAIHAHIFYPDLAAEFAKFFRNVSFTYDLFVSVPDASASSLCKQQFSGLPQLDNLTIKIVPNRGRDIAPMFCTFGDVLKEYDFIAHIHSKKSLYNKGATNGWREYLLTHLFGSDQQIRRIFTLLTGKNNIGLVYPQNFSSLPYSAYTWLSNQAIGRTWCHKLGINPFPTGYFDFPAGSMFWARTEALRPLFDAEIKLEEFSEESGQTDATLAHCLERLLVLVTRKSGFNAAILRDTESGSWSRWRFEQYLARKPENIQAMLNDPSVQVIVFDIFDTLLTRPLLYPEKIKSIIAQQADQETGKVYLELRATAESHARQKAGRDIGLEAIFEELAHLSGLPSQSLARLRQLEETIEMAITTPRPEVIALFHMAINLGKRVVLASDMYLTKPTIEAMLIKNGVTNWHQLFVSSDLGLRKDTGDFYRHLLSLENVSPHNILIIGDNEHSDVQIPSDMDIKKILHVLRPVELARAMPRLGPLVENFVYQDNLNAQLTLGTIVQANFHPLTFPRFDPSDMVPASPWSIGFTVAGPLILSFVQWLEKRAAADNIRHLFFLSREGQILKMVYDRWFSNDTQSISSDYLVLSRRSIAVPMISNLEDIFEIARIQFSPNELPTFLMERFGITLQPEEIKDLARRKLWPKNKPVNVEDRNIDHLIPLLQALEEKILAQAQDEYPGLMAYLNKMNIDAHDSLAVVDIGYAATIQGRLNTLLNKPVHGYYMITEERAQKTATENNVITQGCFGHFVNAFSNPPLIFKESFVMEKLLSSDDAQIIRYHLGSDGGILPEFRVLTDAEKQTITTRTEMRRGIMDFVDQSVTIREKLGSNFEVPPELAKKLFEVFAEQPSKSELNILSQLALDDYYCGRGLVN